MGTIWHEAMIVTSWDKGVIERARSSALTFFSERFVGEVTPEAINGYRSFLISTSGSKLGWKDYERHQESMREFADALKVAAYEDGSSPVEWVAVRYGSDLDQLQPHILDLAAPTPSEDAGQ